MPPSASKMPTTVQSFSPHLWVCPTVRPENAAAAPRPAMTSRRPGAKFRPSTISTSPRTAKALGSTPRRGTLAGVPVDFLGRSTTT